MRRNLLQFINHACFLIETDSAVLLVDPWLEGPAFNNGWTLLDQSTSNAALIDRLNGYSVPVFVWYSHEHPDHFSISFIKQFRARFRGIATFLYQHTLDKRVTGFLARQGLHVAECRPGHTVALGKTLRLTVFPHGQGDSWCLIQCEARNILNLNDCVLDTAAACRAVQARLAPLAPRVDCLFTQFGYASWVGNPEQPAQHRAAAREKLERIALQARVLRPRLVVPFASFVRFAHPENAFLNAAQNTPRDVVAAPALAPYAQRLRFLRPGSRIDLDADSAASLTLEHEQAVAHWMNLLEGEGALLPPAAPVPLAEVRAAFLAYRAAVGRSLHGLPALLERTGRLAPLVLYLDDVGETLRLSYRHGVSTVGAGAPWQVAMSSSNAVFLFKNEYGHDTTQVNGRFRVAGPQAAAGFARFFLPQRMVKQGLGRQRPWQTLRYLARQALARLGLPGQTARRPP